MLRFISCTLVILMSLTVLLSVSGNVQAHSGHGGDSHHGMVSDMDKMAQPVSHDPLSSHADICGMTVCGPFVEELAGPASVTLVVSQAAFWITERSFVSIEADGSYKPPRA
ncbi:hypothetical protein TH9_11415 [Thalassospira xiamenensis]|uniref:hypothetical protein n=1 Tax=Thalassospira xiamenensis TaxID=220697 RepID=UPI000DED9A9E|nr:hypothetical protein [Thalassospira xiamenensis]RCK33478.1 hypothetical protein TH9_11415 [Thalassospira xiamenensis]